MWFTALKLILQIAGAVTQYMERKQLLDAGEASAIARNLKESQRKLSLALEARRNVTHDADDIKNDPNNRG
jgi:hypothetical protein